MTCYRTDLCSLNWGLKIHSINTSTRAVVMASVVMYVRCIGTWCMTCFITFWWFEWPFLSLYILMFLIFLFVQFLCIIIFCLVLTNSNGKILCGPKAKFASPVSAQYSNCSMSKPIQVLYEVAMENVMSERSSTLQQNMHFSHKWKMENFLCILLELACFFFFVFFFLTQQ